MMRPERDPWADVAVTPPFVEWRGTAPTPDDEWRELAGRYDILDPAAWAKVDAPKRRWRLEGWVPDRQATYITGKGSAGKSLLMQQLVTATAAGAPFLGVPTEACPTLYLSCEDDADELHRRQKAICEALSVPIASLSGKLHLISDVGSPDSAFFAHDEGGKLRATASLHRLERITTHLGIKLIALDNTAHLFAGNENDRHEVASFMAALNRLAIAIDGAVVLIGHPNKAGDSFSGSTAWENQVRSRLFLERPEDSRDSDVRVLSREKSNYARNGETIAFRWHKWAFVRDDDLPTSVRAEIEIVARDNDDDRLFIACLVERTRQKQAVSEKTSSTYAPKVFADMPESRRIGKDRLAAAMERLFRRGEIERALLPWQRDRKDVYGLRQTCADGCADAAPTPCADAPDHSAPTAPNTHLPLKGETGGALSGSPPVPDQAKGAAGAEVRRGPRGEILTPTEAEPRGWLNGANA